MKKPKKNNNKKRLTLTIVQILHPFREFFRNEAVSGILLLISIGIALLWTNSPFGQSYNQFWNSSFELSYGKGHIHFTLLHFVNDVLMALFFFVVGLEIKREILAGELSTVKKASLPIIAALGGMVVPAIIFTLFNHGANSSSGWGIPMATDIAIALGMLALLSKRVPLALKVFLTAVAIADDIGAVLVIAIFYSSNIDWMAIMLSGAVVAALFTLNLNGVKRLTPYAILGIVLWVLIYKSGIHATIAGVLLAATIPAKSKINDDEFKEQTQTILDNFELTNPVDNTILITENQEASIRSIEHTCQNVSPPLQRLELQLVPWVAYGIIPIFALANAGVVLNTSLSEIIQSKVSIGIILGLIFGKQIGITAFAWLACKLGLSELPQSVNWRQIYGVSCLAGIGFTMSLFIADLAFSDISLLNMSKIGILIASLVAGILGLLFLYFTNNVCDQSNEEI